MEVISTTRNEIVSLFLMIREARNGKLSREALVKYVMLRVKMKSLLMSTRKYVRKSANRRNQMIGKRAIHRRGGIRHSDP